MGKFFISDSLNPTIIDFHISNFTALSVRILETYSNVRLTRIPPSGLVKFNI